MSNEQKLKIPGPRSAPHDQAQRQGLQRLTPASQTPPSSENQKAKKLKSKRNQNQIEIKSNQTLPSSENQNFSISNYCLFTPTEQLNSLINTPFTEIQIITLFNQDHSNILSVLSQSLSLLMFNRKRSFANSVADLA